MQDMLIAVVDGLNGFPDAINAVFPQTQVQTYIVHLLRHALSFASWKDRRELAAALRPIYTAVNAEAAREALEDFAAGSWGRKYPPIAPAWRRQWEQVIRPSPTRPRCGGSSTPRMRSTSLRFRQSRVFLFGQEARFLSRPGSGSRRAQRWSRVAVGHRAAAPVRAFEGRDTARAWAMRA